MNSSEAQRVIEALRKGIPPTGYVREFTVGRKGEIKRLTNRLQKGKAGALLLHANYGSGKSHLLRFIREVALDEGYAVSSVTLDAKSAVRFNRMDQMLGAVLRGLEVPGAPGETGLRPFMDLICAKSEAAKALTSDDTFWGQLTDNWNWGYSSVLESHGLFVALRAWATGDPNARNLVEDWLHNPWLYYTERKKLYIYLVQELRRYFRDPRTERQFYLDGLFMFNALEYHQSWAALRDVNRLARAAGLKGLIILFDEFEDVLTNIKQINLKQDAFWNLFQFFNGKKFTGISFFAVTPEFVHKCKDLLQKRGIWDYDFSRFDKLDKFEMSPLEIDEIIELTGSVLNAHKRAYSWDNAGTIKPAHFHSVIAKTMNNAVQDRTRRTITTVVQVLDIMHARRSDE
ncbi:MAG: BREX system ATP-binding domain-containing protein [Chloroflexota bacterium]